MSYYQYFNSKSPTEKVSQNKIFSSTTSSTNNKKVKKSSGCGCGKKKIITGD